MSEEFAHDVTRSAVAHALVALGVRSATHEALEALTDVASHYAQTVGRLAMSIAERGGRSEANVLDVLGALSALPKGLSTGWRELRDFAFEEAGEEGEEFGWDQPFHHVAPPFPVSRALPLFGEEDSSNDAKGGDGDGVVAPVLETASEVNRLTKGGDSGESSNSARCRRNDLIPDYLPPLPPEHTYKRTVREVKEGAPERARARAREERVTRKRQAEDALLSLQSDCEDETVESNGMNGLRVRVEEASHFGELPKISMKERPPRHRVTRVVPQLEMEFQPSKQRLERLKKDDLILEGMLVEGVDD